MESGNETSEDEMDAEEEDALHYEMEEEEKKVSVLMMRRESLQTGMSVSPSIAP